MNRKFQIDQLHDPFDEIAHLPSPCIVSMKNISFLFHNPKPPNPAALAE
jgi:hypothetical protein